jgi:hypothetical protein
VDQEVEGSNPSARLYLQVAKSARGNFRGSFQSRFEVCTGNMKADEKALERLAELIKMGERVLSTRVPPPPNFIGFDSSVNSQEAYQWFTSVQNVLARVFGLDSEHYKNFVTHGAHSLTYSPVYRAQGVLKAAHDDLKQGYLFDLRKLIEAEVLDDFLEQGVALLSAGYYQAAAVVAGCVLEDGLRKLCASNSIPLPVNRNSM